MERRGLDETAGEESTTGRCCWGGVEGEHGTREKNTYYREEQLEEEGEGRSGAKET